MTTQVDHPVETITLNVQGMTCAACVVHVEAALKGVSGVVEASVNLATDQARVEYLDGLTGFESLAEAVADAGYSVEELPPRWTRRRNSRGWPAPVKSRH